MSWFKSFKIIKIFYEWRQIKPPVGWLQKTRRQLEVLSGCQLSTRPKSNLGFPRLAPVVLSLILLGAFGFGGTLMAAQNSLPSDNLYPLKLWSERIHGWLILGSGNKINFTLKLAEKRLLETEQLAQFQNDQISFQLPLTPKIMAVAEPAAGESPLLAVTINRFEDN